MFLWRKKKNIISFRLKKVPYLELCKICSCFIRIHVCQLFYSDFKGEISMPKQITVFNLSIVTP